MWCSKISRKKSFWMVWLVPLMKGFGLYLFCDLAIAYSTAFFFVSVKACGEEDYFGWDIFKSSFISFEETVPIKGLVIFHGNFWVASGLSKDDDPSYRWSFVGMHMSMCCGKHSIIDPRFLTFGWYALVKRWARENKRNLFWTESGRSGSDCLYIHIRAFNLESKFLFYV